MGLAAFSNSLTAICLSLSRTQVESGTPANSAASRKASFSLDSSRTSNGWSRSLFASFGATPSRFLHAFIVSLKNILEQASF